MNRRTAQIYPDLLQGHRTFRDHIETKHKDHRDLNIEIGPALGTSWMFLNLFRGHRLVTTGDFNVTDPNVKDHVDEFFAAVTGNTP